MGETYLWQDCRGSYDSPRAQEPAGARPPPALIAQQRETGTTTTGVSVPRAASKIRGTCSERGRGRRRRDPSHPRHLRAYIRTYMHTYRTKDSLLGLVDERERLRLASAERRDRTCQRASVPACARWRRIYRASPSCLLRTRVRAYVYGLAGTRTTQNKPCVAVQSRTVSFIWRCTRRPTSTHTSRPTSTGVV